MLLTETETLFVSCSTLFYIFRSLSALTSMTTLLERSYFLNFVVLLFIIVSVSVISAQVFSLHSPCNKVGVGGYAGYSFCEAQADLLPFPPSQNKVFIYRGKEYERLADFSSRMQILFPNAEVRVKSAVVQREARAVRVACQGLQ